VCPSKGVLYPFADWKPNGPNLLDKPLKDFIVNPADLLWEWVKRLATSGEKANHGSWVKMFNLCRVLKTSISAVLTDMSSLDSLWNNDK
jgi:hypothetical protein